MSEDAAAQITSNRTIQIAGLVQGLVIGDHNTVNQSFNVTRNEAFVAKEHRPVPANWIERESLVARTVTALKAGSVVALCGMGGSGKTSLAARVAADAALRFEAGSFWIDLAADDTDQALLRIALAFGHDISLLKSRGSRSETVRSLMAGRAVLLVLDDPWATADLDSFLPLPQSCAALLTTRNESLAASVATEVVTVEELPEEDAIALLAAISGGSATEPPLQQVAHVLGGLPLAIELAGKLARKQARRPGFSWAAFGANFIDGSRRLSLGLAGATVRAAFDATWKRGLAAEVQRAFALLGIFKSGDVSTAEAATALDVDDSQALSHLDELIDLSLVRPVDEVTLRLHPLLADYAREMAEHLTQEERAVAHRRVADYLFRIAPRPPRSLSDMGIVLRSHFHAATARDVLRNRRVYPWFNTGVDNVSVPAFLIDRGQTHTLVVHERIEFEMSKDLTPWARSFAYYRLGESLLNAGELSEAEECLQQAVKLMDRSEWSDEAGVNGLSKFLLKLGEVDARLGKLDAAEAALRRAVDINRKQDAGNVQYVGVLEGTLMGLLQLADLFAQSNRLDGIEKGERISREVYAESTHNAKFDIAVIALIRIARRFERSDPVQALETVRTARQMCEAHSGAFNSREGAHGARMLAEIAARLTFNGQSALDEALLLYCLAIRSAGLSEAQQELGYVLYSLGKLFEQYHVIGLAPPLEAAWSCYSLSDRYTKENEGGTATNAQVVIEERIVPRVEESRRSAAASAVASAPWELIDLAIAPHAIGWRPAR